MTPAERRKTLADFLEFEVQPRLDGAQFNMTQWGYSDKKLPPRSTKIERLSDCGFAGCAAGWSFFCPTLRAESVPIRMLSGQKGLITSFSALRDFFGSDPHEIFDPARYPHPHAITLPEVVERLRAAVDS